MTDDESNVAQQNRRRSRPASKPEGIPDIKPQPRKRPSIEDVKDIGGMVEKRWSGVPMWQCPKCNGTTFNEAQSRVHKCKRIKYASEEGLEE